MEVNLCEVQDLCVEAPAGCGKTHLIVQSLANSQIVKPVLVLTHTNAGVDALKKKLKSSKVPSKSYVLRTLDGWCSWFVRSFPKLSGFSATDFESKDHFEKMREASLGVLENENLRKLIKTTYSRVIVDEYQDCDYQQDALIEKFRELLPVVVLGDPMQSIFGFRKDEVVDFSNVKERYPRTYYLDDPWRWKNSGTRELGEWIMRARDELARTGSVANSLKFKPKQVSERICRRNKGNGAIWDLNKSFKDNGYNAFFIVKGYDTQLRKKLAKTIGCLTLCERQGMPDIVRDLLEYDSAENKTEKLIDLLRSISVCCLGDAKARLKTHATTGNFRKSPSELEEKLFNHYDNPIPERALAVLKEFDSYCFKGGKGKPRIYRRDAMNFISDVFEKSSKLNVSLREVLLNVKNTYKTNSGRFIIGSSLLFKGLETDAVVILNWEEMEKEELYVALSRASKEIVLLTSQ